MDQPLINKDFTEQLGNVLEWADGGAGKWFFAFGTSAEIAAFKSLIAGFTQAERGDMLEINAPNADTPNDASLAGLKRIMPLITLCDDMTERKCIWIDLQANAQDHDHRARRNILGQCNMWRARLERAPHYFFFLCPPGFAVQANAAAPDLWHARHMSFDLSMMKLPPAPSAGESGVKPPKPF